MHPIIYMISPPRCGSVMMTRLFETGKYIIFHEPTIKPYDDIHYSKETAEWWVPNAFNSYEEIANAILEAAKTGPVFVKDMATCFYEFRHIWYEASKGDVRYVALVRNAKNVVHSYNKTAVEGGNNFSKEVIAGFAGFKEMVDIKFDAVVKYEDLTTDPKKAIADMCDQLKIPNNFSITWEPKSESFDGSEWHENKKHHYVWVWHGKALSSSGINQRKHTTPKLDKNTEWAYTQNAPYAAKFDCA